jgi:ABC-2 type transport system ATP-binding protein
MNELAIKTANLSKHFGSLRAVQEVSLEVRQGEIFSLLGPNGAGKSTIISMLAGLLEPTSGEAWVMGQSILTERNAAQALLGVVPQEVALYPDLSARENLDFWGKMYGLRGARLRQRVDEVLRIIGLADRQKERIETYSGGMKRRVNIGVALLHEPPLVIMDEPTVGIDPQSRRHILDNVKALNEQGMTVLYTTHYMEEAQELSHRIGIMDHGRLIAIGTLDELTRQVGEYDTVHVEVEPPRECMESSLTALPGVRACNRSSNQLALIVEDANAALPAIISTLSEMDARVTRIEVHEPNLEALFLHLTGRALRDE